MGNFVDINTLLPLIFSITSLVSSALHNMSIHRHVTERIIIHHAQKDILVTFHPFDQEIFQLLIKDQNEVVHGVDRSSLTQITIDYGSFSYLLKEQLISRG